MGVDRPGQAEHKAGGNCACAAAITASIASRPCASAKGSTTLRELAR
jgi:hypothetical protein